MDVDKILPDFDDMDTLAKACAEAKFKSNEIKDQIELFIAECVKIAYTVSTYWPNGKQPTQSYIEHVVKVRGNTEEDAKKFTELNESYRRERQIYDECYALLENLRNRISVFQTISANKRTGM